MLGTIFQSAARVSVSASIVIIALLLLLPVLRKRYPAKWRCGVWLLLAVRLLIPWEPELPSLLPTIFTISAPQPAIASIQKGTVPAGTGSLVSSSAAGQSIAQVTPAAPSPLQILAIVWAAGAAAILVCQFAGYFLFRRSVWKNSREIRQGPTAELWQSLKRVCNIRSKYPLLINRNIRSPMTTGFFHPVLILPSYPFSTMELKIILNHELVHYRRKDLWFKLILAIANAVHWLNPFVWIMVSTANNDLEMVCDAEVVKNSGQTFRHLYVETILSTIQKGNDRVAPFSTCFNGGKKAMKKRLFCILDSGKRRVGVLAFCAVLSGMFIASSLTSCQSAGLSDTGSSSQPQGPQSTSSAVSSSSSQTSLASSSSNAELPKSKTVPIATAASPAITTVQQAIDKIQKAIPLDWKKYELKEKEAVTIRKIKYWKFELWDDSYFQTPFILVNPQDGSVYTWLLTDSAPVPAAEDKAFDKTPQTLTAVIFDFTMNSIALKTSDGYEFTVPKNMIDTSGLNGATYGDKVKITYTGVKKGNDFSRVFFQKIEKA